MRIGINMSGIRESGAGGSTYVLELLDGLQRVAPEVTLSEFAYRNRFSRQNRALRAMDTLRRQSMWLNRSLPRQIRAQGIDVFHNPGSQIPLTCPVPLVVTIHDLYMFRNPASFRWWHQASTRFFTRQALERADRIIAISQFTRQEIAEVFGPEYDDKITVIHEAANPRFAAVPSAEGKAVITRHRLEKPYVLCVSTIEPRKNFAGILGAFARIRDQVCHDLVIVGGMGWKQERLCQQVAELGLEDRVRFLGYVELSDLPALYAQADVFAYPSFYEGFGLPILEAMGCGCPVLTSNAASMSEVAGDAAVLANPNQVSDLAEKLEGMLLDEGLRSRLAKAGLARAATFSWDTCAAETVAVYRSVA